MARRKGGAEAGRRPARPREATDQLGRAARGVEQGKSLARFYEEVLNEAERTLLERARRFSALDEEVSLLRLKLRETMAEHPQDLSRFLKVLEMLVRTLSVQYRVSRRVEEDFSESLLGAVRSLGAVLGFGEEAAQDDETAAR